jgi:hypothetical protein
MWAPWPVKVTEIAAEVAGEKRQNQNVAMNFAPTGITPPNATLAFLGGVQPYVTGSVPGPVSLVDLDGVTTFDPDQYLLTLPDGRLVQISRAASLQTMTDLNGKQAHRHE